MKKEKTKQVDMVIMQIFNEVVDYRGLVNFASRGITGDPEMMMKSFRYGFEIGVECTKKDAVRIISQGGRFWR